MKSDTRNSHRKRVSEERLCVIEDVMGNVGENVTETILSKNVITKSKEKADSACNVINIETRNIVNRESNSSDLGNITKDKTMEKSCGNAMTTDETVGFGNIINKEKLNKKAGRKTTKDSTMTNNLTITKGLTNGEADVSSAREDESEAMVEIRNGSPEPVLESDGENIWEMSHNIVLARLSPDEMIPEESKENTSGDSFRTYGIDGNLCANTSNTDASRTCGNAFTESASSRLLSSTPNKTEDRQSQPTISCQQNVSKVSYV